MCSAGVKAVIRFSNSITLPGETMKKIPKTILVDAYTDDDGKPVCGECKWNEMRDCCHGYSNKWHVDMPTEECPVWRKQDDTGAEDDQP